MADFFAELGYTFASSIPYLLVLAGLMGILYAWIWLPEDVRFRRWLVRLRPRNARQRFELARRLAANKPEAAVEELRQAIAIDPNFRDAYFPLAGLQTTEGHLDDAWQTVRRAQRLFPDDPRSQAQEGWCLDAEGDIAGAERALRKAIAMAPKKGEKTGWLHSAFAGFLRYRLQDLEGAERAYLTAINNCYDLMSLFNLVTLYSETQRYGDAIKYLRNFAARNRWDRDNISFFLVHLARLHMANNQQTEARRVIRRGASHSKSALDAYNAASLLRQLGHQPEAERAYKRAIAKNPALVQAYEDLTGAITGASGRPNVSGDRAAYREGRYDPELIGDLARLLPEPLDERKAIELLGKALGIDPVTIADYLALASFRMALAHEMRSPQSAEMKPV